MSGWTAIIGAIFQVILLLLQSYYAKESDAKQSKADKAKQISDAVASGDVARINAVIQQLRR